MNKVLLHNLSHPFAHVNSQIFHCDQGAVFFAEDGDIVITRKSIDSSYLDFLGRIGYDVKGVKFINADMNFGGFDAIFHDRGVASKLAVLAKRAPYQFDVYVATSLERRYAEQFGLRLCDNADQFEFGSKSGFRRMAAQLDIPIPSGFEDVNSVREFLYAGFSLFHRGAKNIVVKQDEGVAGLGMRRMGFGEFFRQACRYRRFVASLARQGVHPRRSRGHVVEQWLDDVCLAPSVQFRIHSLGDLEVLSIHAQIIDGNGQSYIGCLSRQAVPEGAREWLGAYALRAGEYLAERGARGYFALGTILLKSGMLLCTELNARKVGSSYPHAIARKLFGARVADCHYKSILVRNGHLKGWSIAQLLDFIEPILYSPARQAGVIPLWHALLGSEGKFFALMMGSDFCEVQHLHRRLLRLLGNL